MTTKEDRQKKMRRVILAFTLLLVSGMGAGIVSQQASKNGSQPNVALDPDGREGYVASPGKGANEGNELNSIEDYWLPRVTYPTGRFSGAWLQAAARQDKQVQERVPAGRVTYNRTQSSQSPLNLDPNSWTTLGPQPLQSD